MIRIPSLDYSKYRVQIYYIGSFQNNLRNGKYTLYYRYRKSELKIIISITILMDSQKVFMKMELLNLKVILKMINRIETKY